MNLNVDFIQSQFQAVVAVFIKERDQSIANINKLLYSDEPNVKKITKEIRKLTEAKMNIANTQEELRRVTFNINQMNNNQMDNTDKTEDSNF